MLRASPKITWQSDSFRSFLTFEVEIDKVEIFFFRGGFSEKVHFFEK